MKKFFIIFLTFLLAGAPGFALELDTALDDEIRRNYNPSKLELEALPPLPKISEPLKTPAAAPYKSTPAAVPKTTPINPSSAPANTSAVPKTTPAGNVPKKLPAMTPVEPVSASDSSLKGKVKKDVSAIKIPKGTKFRVVSHDHLTDYMARGRKLTFSTTRPVTKRYITVPQTTVFRGVIVDSHPPQITGNGGLLVLKVDKMHFNGKEYPVNASITKANTKKIFLNNIKGKRGYLSGAASSTRPGRTFYHNMVDITSRLAEGPFTVLLSPFTVIAGVVVLGVNVIGSPLFGLFYKGGRLAIPAGCEFEVKFLEDLYLE
jgi:hypothetical protein